MPSLIPNKLVTAELSPICSTPVYFAGHKSFGALNNEIFVVVLVVFIS